jgi:hypothetical protein
MVENEGKKRAWFNENVEIELTSVSVVAAMKTLQMKLHFIFFAPAAKLMEKLSTEQLKVPFDGERVYTPPQCSLPPKGDEGSLKVIRGSLALQLLSKGLDGAFMTDCEDLSTLLPAPPDAGLTSTSTVP